MRLSPFFLMGLVLALTLPRSAQGGKLFLDAGWGLSSISKAGSLLGTDASLSMGDALLTSIGYDFADSKDRFRFELAAQARLYTGSSNGIDSLGILALMPVVRLNYRFLFLGSGASPLLMTRSANSFGVSGLSSASGSIAALAEVGGIHRFSPEFALTVSSGLLWVQTGTTMGPAPAWDLQIGARLYLGNPQAASKSVGDYDYGDNYRGWRYPFGRGQ